MAPPSEPSASGRSAGNGGSATAGRGRRGHVPSVGASVEFTRIEIRRGVRWLGEQDFWLLYGLVAGVFFLFASYVAFDAGQSMGATLAAGEESWLAETGVAVAVSTLWLFQAAILAVDALGSNGDVENDGHYLTIRPVADVAGGKLLAAATKFSIYPLPLVGAGFLGVAVGADSPLPLVGGLAAAAVVVVTTAAVGYPVGLALKGVVRRSATLTRLKPVLGAAVGLAYVLVMFTGEFTTVVDRLVPALTAPPLGWLGDLALVTTPNAGASAMGAVGAVVAAAVVVVVGTLLTVPAGRYAWRADRARPAESEKTVDATPPDHAVDRLLGAVCRRQATRGVASTALLRAYRSPLQLVFVAVPLLAAIPLGEQVLATGELPWYAPWLAAWYGAWAAGAALPLNPLGSQGAGLPALLTSPAEPRHVVHGNVVAAALPAVPVTVALAVGAGVLDGRAGTELAVLGAGSAAAVVAAAVLAAGVGATFPRFEAVDFGGSREAVPPSKVAYAVFSMALTLTVAAVAVLADDLARELVALLLSTWLPFGVDVGADALTTVAWVVLAAVAVSVPLAYRVAVRRIATYRLS